MFKTLNLQYKFILNKSSMVEMGGIMMFGYIILTMRSVILQLKRKFQAPLFKNLSFSNCLVLLLLPLFAVVVSFIFHPNFFTSVLLFLGLPAVYISTRAPKYIFKSIIFSLLASLPLIVIIDYIGRFSSAWAFPPSLFHFVIMGRVKLEPLLWAFLNIYTVVIFYEYLFDNHVKVRVWSKKMWALVRYLLVWVVLFALALIFLSEPITIPYFYLVFGLIIFIFPIVMTWLYYPRILPKIVLSLIYFSYLSFLYEVTALINGWWYFPGTQFVGYVTFGNISFPLEELVFWIILFAPSVISAFEYLDDDCK
jgi:hypothetical protein